jgi:transcriptional regulator with PAS, ATPase and Fis domain
MKTLISWVDTSADFENGQILEKGPTIGFHKYFYKHDRHILLSPKKGDDIRAERLQNILKNKYPERHIEVVYLEVDDSFDHRQIQLKIKPFLISLKDDVLDLFINTGTPAMQLVWYLSHMSLHLKTTLFQTKEAKHTATREKPELLTIELAQTSMPIMALYHHDQIKRSMFGEDYKITPSIQKIYDNAKKVAETDEVTVLLLGASGTGKENLAKFIHSRSARKDKPYIPINCSAFNDQLLESRLFGYKKGAFTGADKDSTGLFEQANEGTIFLDEIGDISSYMQQALLRVLQEKEIMPLGGKPKKINVRVIAATNQNLVKLCEEGNFRWDLYYRLSVVELDIPTLLQRGKAELKMMIEYFLNQKRKQFKKAKKLVIDKDAMEVLLNYSYPGNMRELENIISRLYVFNEELVTADVLPKRLFQEPTNKPMNWEHIEKEHIIKVLNHFKGNKRQTAKAIGWAINTLISKMEKYEIKSKD